MMVEGSCLRIYLTESSRIDGVPAMEAILTLCRKAGLTGVSVVRGIEGMGGSGVHSSSFLALSSDLPLLVEVIDTRARIEQAMEAMRPHLAHCLVASWPVSLMRTEYLL
ncbi:MAG: DUF190 domain-containing protein [Mariprofundus sp.]|nr:DUF190 domain-containing protein [Mariprofundus sp.]